MLNFCLEMFTGPPTAEATNDENYIAKSGVRVMKTDFVSLSNVLQYCNLMTPKEVQLLYMSCGVFACVRASMCVREVRCPADVT